MRNMFCWGVVLCGLLITQQSHLQAARYDYAKNGNDKSFQSDVQSTTIQWQNEGSDQGGQITQGDYANNGYYDSYDNSNQGSYDSSYSDQDYVYNGDDQECCEPSVCGGECLSLCSCYQPTYYNAWRCIQVPKTCKKKCCRYVPREYQVQHCRYIPQYYTETCCCYVPEYYYVDESVMCEKWICEKKCKNVPRYYYKRTTCAPNCECE